MLLGVCQHVPLWRSLGCLKNSLLKISDSVFYRYAILKAGGNFRSCTLLFGEGVGFWRKA